MILSWPVEDAIEMDPNVQLPQFDLTAVKTEDNCTKTYKTGKPTEHDDNIIY